MKAMITVVWQTRCADCYWTKSFGSSRTSSTASQTDEEFPPTNNNTSAEKVAFDRFYELYEEVSRELVGAQA